MPPLPSSALRDLLGVLRVLWWVRWAAGAGESELKAIASAGDDVGRLVRAARFDACVTTWHQVRLAMGQVVRVGEVVPFADTMLRAGVRRILQTPGIPPPPLHAYAAPAGERPPGDQEKYAAEPPGGQPLSGSSEDGVRPAISPPDEQPISSGEEGAPRTVRSREKGIEPPA